MIYGMVDHEFNLQAYINELGSYEDALDFANTERREESPVVYPVHERWRFYFITALARCIGDRASFSELNFNDPGAYGITLSAEGFFVCQAYAIRMYQVQGGDPNITGAVLDRLDEFADGYVTFNCTVTCRVAYRYITTGQIRPSVSDPYVTRQRRRMDLNQWTQLGLR